MGKMVALGSLTPNNVPTSEAVKALPKDLETPAADKIDKTGEELNFLKGKGG